MKAAIYARKSTDDKDKGKENQSVTRQIEQSKSYICEKGWSVDDEHIYVDDGVSGTEFPRPGLMKLVDNLSEFNVVVMMNGDRLGREQEKTPYYRTKIRKKVKLFYYLTDKEAVANTPIEKYMEQTWDLISAMEVEHASQRARDALTLKAKKGYNVGGIVYGYDNVWVYPDGSEEKATPIDKPKNTHTEFRINKKEADIIRRIYIMYAAGHGHTAIAKTMNGDPRYQDKNKKYFNGYPASPRKGSGSWAPSSVRAILYNERYIGKLHYGKYKNVREDGKKIRVKQDNVITADAPELRIIDKKLWTEVQTRLKSVAKTYIRDNDGNLWGRPGTGIESKYLLTALGHCTVCGSNITLLGGRSGTGKKRKSIYYYGCSHHTRRGSTICANDHKERMEVLEAIEQQVLTPDAITYTIEKAYELVQEQLKSDPERPRAIEAEIRKLRNELNNFMGLIASGKAPASILEQVAQRENRINQLEKEQAQLQTIEPTEIDMRRIKKALQSRIGRFKELIYSDVPVARQALRKLLAEPMQFSPVMRDGRKAYGFKGKIITGALIDPGYIQVASPRGFDRWPVFVEYQRNTAKVAAKFGCTDRDPLFKPPGS